MSPLEKYIPDKNNNLLKGEKLSNSQKERNDRVIKKLENFRKAQKDDYEKLKTKTIKETLKKLKNEEKVDENNESIDVEQKLKDKFSLERRANYKELLKDEQGNEVREFAYGEITNFEFNQEVFHGKDGWLDEFNKESAPKKISLEKFTLNKQYDELEKIRKTLSEERVLELLPRIYKDLESEDKLVERDKKAKETSKIIENFFENNKKNIEDYLNSDSIKKVELRKDLLVKFKNDAFADIKDSQVSEFNLVENLFDNLVSDYSAMLDQRDYVKQLNPEMTAALSREGINKEEWDELLGKKADKEAKKMVQEKERKQEDKVLKNPPLSPDLNREFYNRGAVTEKMGVESKINFQRVGPGQFRIIFPSETADQFSMMYVREVIEAGKKKRLYVFKDPLLDHHAVVGENEFVEQVNGLFIDHSMNEIKQGKDYVGPDLNDVLHDQEMNGLAEQLFYPKRLNKGNIEKQDILAFKNLMLVLTNNSNSERGEGTYGNMQAIRNRIALLKYVLGMENGNKARTFYKILTGIKPDQLKKLSVEQLCKMSGIERNYGNFSKN